MAALGLAVLAERYTYAETNYANPHALTGFFNGSATTTYAYDAIGNLATTSGAATSTFNWDYRNRMIRAWIAGATSTAYTWHGDVLVATIEQVLVTQGFDDDRDRRGHDRGRGGDGVHARRS
jgi:YD repeat-containing protein